MGHPEVAEAAVIAVPDSKWGERPLLIVVPKAPNGGGEALKRSVLQYLALQLAKYALPNDVVFVKEIPHNATGKTSKLTLREMFKDYRPPGSRL